MITKHLLLGLIFGTSVSIISWILGIILGFIVAKTEYYKKLSHLNFIESKALNQKIGLKYFKWMVKNTFFKFFNQSIQVSNRNTDLNVIRNEMTSAEINHLIGFVLVTLVAIYKSFEVSLAFGLPMMLPNLLLNLYPSLLQQENKRRIDKLINRQKRAHNIKG